MNENKFNFIRYANVWEDADILCAALAPTASQGRILSIASSGDNALALLTLDPREILAVDFSAPQLACLELRIAAFRELDHAEVCAFLGVLPSQDRVEVYQARLRRHLRQNAAAFWDADLSCIRRGIIHAGKFERYLRLFGKWVLPLVHSKAVRDELLQAKTQGQRALFYEETWDTWRWRLLFKVFFSRFVMGHAGRDPSFFKHVEGSVADEILARSKRALTDAAAHENPFLHYIMKGNFSPAHLPTYLRPEHFSQIRARLDRICLLQGSVADAPGSFDAFNLSDIFEYMDAEVFAACYQKLLAKANAKARMAYWNMLALRSFPKHALAIADALHKQDKAWFYRKFIVEECP